MPEIANVYQHSRSKVHNRGRPPIAFLDELAAWGCTASDDIFQPNARYDIYSSIVAKLGPWRDMKHRRAAMLEVLRVLAGFESSWNWEAGVDRTNPSSNTPCTEEAGIFQCSGDSLRYGADLVEGSRLRETFQRFGGTGTGDDACNWFRSLTKTHHAFAMEYCARLLRFTTKHHGPVKHEKIHEWLNVDAMNEIERML